MSTALVPYKPDFSGLENGHADFHTEQFKQSRRSLLSELRCLCGLSEVIRSLNPDTLYKVIIPEGKLLQQGKDGFFRGVFYGDRGIAQHAKFAAVTPSLMAAAKAIGSQVLLISIVMQLNRIENLVQNLSIEMHRDRIAEISSGVAQFEEAMLCQDISHREKAVFNAVQTLHTGIQKTLAELGSRIAEAPDPNSVLYHFKHWDKTKEAAKIMGLAYDSFQALLRGIKTLGACPRMEILIFCIQYMVFRSIYEYHIL